MKLIVLNLPRDLTEGDLAELFRVHGDIAACNLVLDDRTGASKGFGFVETVSDDTAEAAIAVLHGSVLNNQKIRVKPAE